MILNIFILISAIETIAKRPPQSPPDGGPIIKYLPEGVDPDGPRIPGGPQGTKKLPGCIQYNTKPRTPRPKPKPIPPRPRPGQPGGPRGKRMRWLLCSLDFCVVT